MHNNTPQWPKPEAASTSTAAPAASTASRSPRTVGDSPHTATFLMLQAFFGSAGHPLLTQDESSTPAPHTHSRAAVSPRLILIQGLRPEDHHGSMRPRRHGRGRINVRQSASTPMPASGHLLRGEGQGTDCPKPPPKVETNMFPPAGVFWVAAGRSGTDGGLRYAPSERTPADKMPRGARTRSPGPCGPNRVQRRLEACRGGTARPVSERGPAVLWPHVRWGVLVARPTAATPLGGRRRRRLLTTTKTRATHPPV